MLNFNLLSGNITYLIVGIALALICILAITLIFIVKRKPKKNVNTEDFEINYAEDEQVLEDSEFFKGIDKKTGLAIVARYKYSFNLVYL